MGPRLTLFSTPPADPLFDSTSQNVFFIVIFGVSERYPPRIAQHPVEIVSQRGVSHALALFS